MSTIDRIIELDAAAKARGELLIGLRLSGSEAQELAQELRALRDLASWAVRTRDHGWSVADDYAAALRWIAEHPEASGSAVRQRARIAMGLEQEPRAGHG